MNLNKYSSLLLNADYTPLNLLPLSVKGWKNTILGIYKEIYIPVEYYDLKIHSEKNEYQLPSIVALKKYVVPSRKIVFNRFNVLLRDEFKCCYCDTAFSKHNHREMTFDHVIPKSQGGKSNWTNVVIACVKCNTKKADKSVAAAKMKLIRKPRMPSKEELFSKHVKNVSALNIPDERWLSYIKFDEGTETKIKIINPQITNPAFADYVNEQDYWSVGLE